VFLAEEYWPMPTSKKIKEIRTEQIINIFNYCSREIINFSVFLSVKLQIHYNFFFAGSAVSVSGSNKK
jgi:hypothetical protein